MIIDFDPHKRQQTLDLRGLDMARSAEIFAGVTLTLADDRFAYGEQRFITIGYLDGRMVVLVWTGRGKARRIISMRKANEREQKIYEPRLG
jgi:uncharacterized DUF497 family protein